MFISSYLSALILSFVLFDLQVVGTVDSNEIIDIDSQDETCEDNSTETQEKKLNIHQKVMYGFESDVKNHPSVVALFIYNWFRCGGVILSSASVITAAHCVTLRGTYTIRAGSTYREDGSVYQVIKILMHPNYDEYYQDYDIAILTLDRGIKFSKFARSVTLVTRAVPANVEVEAYGWGLTENGQNSKRLKGIKLFTISFNECFRRLDDFLITKSMLCAEDKSKYHRKDTCIGDSGGPLYYKGLLAGLTSWGNDCYSNKKDPSVYSNVFEVRNWIRKNIVYK